VEPFVVLSPGVLDGRSAGDVVPLPPETAQHLRTVLRRPAGSPLVLADGAGTTVPASLAPPAGARCEAAPTTSPSPRPALHVLQGLPKGRKLDEVVRTLTELGVDRVTPVESDRSVVRLEGPKRDKAVTRWRSVATAAAEQSRRAHLPVIDAPATVDEILDELAADGDGTVVVVAHVGAGTPLADALPRPDGVACLVLAVGPEGGWTADEVAAFRARGAAVATLGSSVLRTEHAAPALAAIATFTLGRMV
jgi:16S rRNA (uracil1498-N3)-methyltransferase